MIRTFFFPSLTRNADLTEEPFELANVPKKEWKTGDFVAVRVMGRPNPLYKLELCDGRLMELMSGDRFIGVLGKRSATLEAVGDWQKVEDDLMMQGLTPAGLLGKATSVSPLLPPFMDVSYKGHLQRYDKTLNMRDFVLPVTERQLQMPVILLVGTSMSAGKTTTGRVLVHELKRHSLKVIGAKFTGAARLRDILSFADAGADAIFDFVDMGLPSTVVSPGMFREAMSRLLSRIAATGADVLVAEAGASPLEPYNGSIACELLKPHISCRVLSASDPYAVVGVQQAFGFTPDLVTGPAGNTEAARDLVKELTGLEAVNIMSPDSLPRVRAMLQRTGVLAHP